MNYINSRMKINIESNKKFFELVNANRLRHTLIHPTFIAFLLQDLILLGVRSQGYNVWNFTATCLADFH